MFNYTPELEAYGCALVAYKSIMNTNEYRNQVIGPLVAHRSVDFVGSFMVFDPVNETTLEAHYFENGEPTTEGERASVIIDKLTDKISRSRKKYICFTMGSIMETNNVCHHVAFLVSRVGNELIVKMMNSGMYYLSNSYGQILENVMCDVGDRLGLSTVFFHPYIGIAWMGFSVRQRCNPQDYCRGGLMGELSTFVDYRKNIHRESYCQTWCIAMLKHEVDQIKALDDYDIRTNYMTSWSTDKKTLEIQLRRFIIGIVEKFEHCIDFLNEFELELIHADVQYVTEGTFSQVLRAAFRNLHTEI